MAKTLFECWFAVGDPNGEQSLRWVVWANESKDGRNDIYVGPEGRDAPLKISLHRDGRSHGGFSAPAAKRLKLPGDKRHAETWHTDRGPTGPGALQLFRVYVPRSDLRPARPECGSIPGVQWIPAAPLDLQTTITLFNENANEHPEVGRMVDEQLSASGFRTIQRFSLPNLITLSLRFCNIDRPDMEFLARNRSQRLRRGGGGMLAVYPSPREFATGRIVVGGGSPTGVRCLWDLAIDQFAMSRADRRYWKIDFGV